MIYIALQIEEGKWIRNIENVEHDTCDLCHAVLLEAPSGKFCSVVHKDYQTPFVSKYKQALIDAVHLLYDRAHARTSNLAEFGELQEAKDLVADFIEKRI